MRKYVNIFFIILCLMCILTESVSFADAYSLSKIENIISGSKTRTYKLAFATITSVKGDSVTVEIHELINPDDDSLLVNDEIQIENFDSYMYFDEYDRKPKFGDVVLLSITFGGDIGKIKDGAFLVSAASSDFFKFKIPDTIEPSEQAELDLLYRYVKSGGENFEYSIIDGVIYDGEGHKMEGSEAFEFLDEYGQPIGNSGLKPNVGDYSSEVDHERSWIYALMIIGFGAVLGLAVMKLIQKIEKRSDSQ